MRAALFLLTLFLFACKQDDPRKEIAAEKRVYFPYRERLQIEFENGQQQIVLTALQFWKLYESGNMKDAASLFADSVQLVSLNSYQKNSRSRILDLMQKERDQLSIAQCHMDWWKAARINGAPAVLVWAQLEGTKKDGGKSSAALHQIFLFNEHGQISSLQQYSSPFHW